VIDNLFAIRVRGGEKNTVPTYFYTGGWEAKMKGEDESFDRLRTWVWALEEVRSRLETERGEEEEM